MILTAKNSMTDQEKLWWVTCITANRFRFGFGRQANRTLKNLKLPDSNDTPKWVNTINHDCYNGIEKPDIKKSHIDLLNISEWNYFQLQNLFDIKKGQRLTKTNMIPGIIPYIGASNTANGITTRIGQKPIHKGGTISVTYDGSIAEAFYQPEPFWASDAVNVLYPKSFNLTPAIALFVCTIIRIEKYRFNYGRKWHLERMRESIIKLPVTKSGEPDFIYMEKYIKSLPYSSQIN